MSKHSNPDHWEVCAELLHLIPSLGSSKKIAYFKNTKRKKIITSTFKNNLEGLIFLGLLYEKFKEDCCFAVLGDI